MTRPLLTLALALTGCVADFPTVSPNAVGADAGRLDAGLDAVVDRPDAALINPDAAPIDRDAALADRGAADADLPVDRGVRPVDMAPACVPTDEICNGEDEDCDGLVDEDVPGAGDDCELGVGACARAGVRRCDPASGALLCTAMPGMEIVEICNGIDDDCDGVADEDLGLGEPCTVGVGECAAPGQNVCGAEGAVVCNAEPRGPEDELCNALDDDCDGLIDEAFPLGDRCEAGVGACSRAGVIACVDEDAVCDAAPGQPEDELCNEIDDDCDGNLDEDLAKGEDCEVGVGACFARGENICAADGSVVCGAEIIEPVAERCNDIDDDCDGETDEGLLLGEPCFAGIGECTSAGEKVCGDADDVICDAVPSNPRDERCDGLDDDCDTRIDEGDACADEAIARCQVWLGWRDNYGHNAQRSLETFASWGDCPRQADDENGSTRCNSTRRNEKYQSLPMSGSADGNDLMGVRFTCEGSEVADWVQQHCEVFVAYGDLTAPATIEALDPETCGSTFSPSVFEPDVGCVRTGHDELFHPIAFVGGVNFDDAWGVAFRCGDDALPDRAAGLQSSLLVHFALQDRGRAIAVCSRPRIRDTLLWQEADAEPCPLIGSDLLGRETCASSSGDGAFHGVKTNQGQLGSCWAMGVALKRTIEGGP